MPQPVLDYWPLAVAAIVAVIAAVTDLRSGKIYNALTYPAALLGLIGNAEACEPLARALTDPTLGIQSPVAHALGQIGGFDSLQALLRNLRNLDQDALGETVDSLARIGDSAAILPLICLMDDLEDADMRRRIAAALAQLTETPTTEEVISLFTSAPQAKRPAVMV